MDNFRGIKLKAGANSDTPQRYRVHSIETAGEHRRLALTGRTVGASQLGWDEDADPADVATVYFVSRKNDLGLPINSWVFLWRNRVYARLSGHQVVGARPGTRKGRTERGQYVVHQGRWTTLVRYLGAVIPDDSTETARNLAYADEDTLPILADALEEAGCTDADLLASFRS